MELRKVISGGQTGVDRAALEAALACSLSIGGWCPKGRRAEDGVIPARYPLTEAASSNYAVRTRLNVRDSDATLIVTLGMLDGGTQLTAKLAESARKPFFIVRAHEAAGQDAAIEFIRKAAGSTLNVAGPRESRVRGIFAFARDFLVSVFRSLDREDGEIAVFVPKKPPRKGGAEA